MNEARRSPITCDEFDALLPDLFEDALDERVRASADAHASQCARCRGLLSDLAELRGEASRLPVLKPSHDLWDNISARIETPPIAFNERTVAARRSVRARLAAAAVILVAVTAGATWIIARRDIAPAVVASVPSVAPQQDTTGAVSFRLASAYDDEIAALRKRMAEHPAVLDSATARVIAANLRIIDDAIARVRVALDAAPANLLLSQQLMRAYDMKLNTLRQIAALQSD
jgi:hypothetical protein